MASPEKYKAPVAGGNFKDKDIQAVIGLILRAGVIISMIVVFTGGVLFLYRHGQTQADYHTFKGVPGFIESYRGIINGTLGFKGQAIIQAGIILLIATPVVRVIVSAIGFIIEKDYLYVVITLVVLSIIFFSMLTGHIG